MKKRMIKKKKRRQSQVEMPCKHTKILQKCEGVMRNSWRDAKRGGEGDKQSLKKLKEDPETVIKRTLDTA